MTVELNQRRYLLRRTYALAADGIRVSERSLLSGRTVTVPYEVLFGKRVEVLTSSKRAFWVAAVLATISVTTAVASNAERFAWLFWGALAALAAVAFAASRRDQVGFADDGNRILFLRDRPSAAALDAFWEAATAEARERVRLRILPLRPTEDVRADRLRAAWLRDKRIITVEEYAAFEARLGPAPEPVNARAN